MIAYLKGEITEIHENDIWIEVGQIGYEVFVPYEQNRNVLQRGKQVKLYIFENIKEDAHDLYGFVTVQQKELFKKLVGVNGIGPKTALQMMNLYDVDHLIEIIMMQDHKALGKVSGIGPKTAQRIILELKDVVQRLAMPDLAYLEKGLPEATGQAKEEAIAALEALGFPGSEARKSVQAIFDYNDTTETIIKKALALLTN
ncbi:MAG: Holliday junction branch migration protein RuvA [Niameybacter sp.]|uniref:Holliday junction branch migration protein RuvA n=1 Tax=Niameybacter sp. TaxID=2033640 RepID=UPI002FC59D44